MMERKKWDAADSIVISNMIFLAHMAQGGDRERYLDSGVKLMKKQMEEGEYGKITHIIFDLDGTLIDTEQPVLRAWQDTLKKHHYEFALEELKPVLGVTAENALRTLNVSVKEQFWGDWMEMYDRYAGEAVFFDGAEEMLRTLKAQGFGLGAVTSRTKEELERYFAPFRLETRFGRIICSDDTEKHKPNPEPLLRYGELEGVSMEACVYVGDMPTDIQCANEAGAISGLAVWNGSGVLCRDTKLLFRSPEELCGLLGAASGTGD